MMLDTAVFQENRKVTGDAVKDEFADFRTVVFEHASCIVRLVVIIQYI